MFKKFYLVNLLKTINKIGELTSHNTVISMEQPVMVSEMKSQVFTSICRTCLGATTMKVNIFDSSVAELLKQCANIQVRMAIAFEKLEVGDGLPENICENCMTNMNKAIAFRRLCENSDGELRQKLVYLENDAVKCMERICKNEYNDHHDEGTDDLPNQKVDNVENNRSSDDESYLHLSEDVRCSICGLVTDNESLEEHMRFLHPSENTHICYECNKHFKSVSLLKKHISYHRLKKKHKCPICEKYFQQTRDLKIHERTHTREKPISCTICDKTFADPRGLRSHLKSHKDEKPHHCNVCDKSFTHMFTLKNHLKTHSQERQLLCKHCGKSFKYLPNMIRHSRTHTGERPYNCDVCGKSFRTSSDLVAHSLVHKTYKRFSCKVCGKTVSRSGDLKIHMRMHTGEKPYSCKICTRTFRVSSHLSRHMKSHIIQ